MSSGQPDKPKPNEPVRPMPRWSLMLVAGLHAGLFAWAGSKLPWSEWSGFAIACYVLALGHALTAVTAALRLRALVPIWRVSSVLGLITLGWLSWELTSSAAYLAELYGDLGQGLGSILYAVVALFALPTLPISCWGLAATWKRSYTGGLLAALPVLLTIWTIGALRQADSAALRQLPLPGDIDRISLHEAEASNGVLEQLLFDTIDAQIYGWGLPEIPIDGPIRKVEGGFRHAKLRVPSLLTTEPIACVPDPSDGQAVAVLTYLRLLDGPAPKPKVDAPVEVVSRCVRAAPEDIMGAIVAQIKAEAVRAPVKIDLIRGVDPLETRSRVLDMVALRPGLDGVCDENHCLMPWQLVAADQFQANEPLPWIPDFRFGISPVQLRAALGFEVPADVMSWDRELRNPKRHAKMVEAGKATPRPSDAASWELLEGLTRIETFSYVVTDSGMLVGLVRMHAREQKLSQRRLDYARLAAETHIANAQLRSGRFRYTLHPFTGKQRTKNWNLPRQAGTTLIMCEHGQNQARTKQVARRSLGYMAEHARASGELRALAKGKIGEAHLGSTALPAIAFLSCRRHVGELHDELIVGLTKFLLAMQRDDGSFYPAFDVQAGHVVDGPEPMYAGGQAVFALTLAEKLALDEPELAAQIGLPDVQTLHDAVERAMAYYTGPYWDTFMRDFFWLEENWHCLAARASLEHHRNDAYEQYCIDYITWKSRLVLDEDSRVASEFVGSYSFGNILTPVNTPAAGFGEGLAAAMALKQARGEDLEADTARMREVIRFLLRQQWNKFNCFACTPNRTVIGGFSESMSVAEIRIDYTQHAWSALGHGGAWIYDDLPAEIPGDP